MSEIVFDRASTWREITCHVDESFNLAFRLGVKQADGNEVALNLTGKTLEFFIRPLNDHATLIKKLTSGIGSVDTVLIDIDPTEGRAAILISQATMSEIFPSGVFVFAGSQLPYTCHQMLRTKQGDTYFECWRGPLVVKPYRTS